MFIEINALPYYIERKITKNLGLRKKPEIFELD